MQLKFAKDIIALIFVCFLLAGHAKGQDYQIFSGGRSTFEPSYFGYKATSSVYAQIIYPGPDLEVSGKINSLSFFYLGTVEKAQTNRVLSNHVKIFLGTTEKTEFVNSEDWVPLNQMSLVYEGPIILNPAAEWISIPVDTFVYNSRQNLVLGILDYSSAFLNEDISVSSYYPRQPSIIKVEDGIIDPFSPGYGMVKHNWAPDVRIGGQFENSDYLSIYPYHRTTAADSGSSAFFYVYPSDVDYSVSLTNERDFSFELRDSGVNVISKTQNTSFSEGPSGRIEVTKDQLSEIAFVFQSPLRYFDKGVLEIINGSIHGAENISCADIDGDADYDLLLRDCESDKPILLRNIYNSGWPNSDFVMLDTLDESFRFSRFYWADIDNDNDPDILLSGDENMFKSILLVNDGSGIFSELDSDIIQLRKSAAEWGDLDNDGDQDLVLSGQKRDGINATKVYWNMGSGTMVEADIDIPGLSGGSVLIIDIDNDYDNDIIISGKDDVGNTRVLTCYNKGHGIFNVVGDLLPSLENVSYVPADINLDGRMDLVCGIDLRDAALYWKEFALFLQNSDGSFTWDPLIRSEPFIGGFEIDPCDIDGDGDIDIAVSSNGLDVFLNNHTVSGEFELVLHEGDFNNLSLLWLDWKNDGHLELLNSSCWGDSGIKFLTSEIGILSESSTPPMNLSSNVEGEEVVFSWDLKGNGCTYNLRIGSEPGASDILSPVCTEDGFHRIRDMGNAANNNGWKLEGLSPGTYYWSVQTIAPSFQASPMSEEQTFEIKNGFEKGQFFMTGNWYSFIGAADFDNDGDYDFLVSNSEEGGRIEVLIQAKDTLVTVFTDDTFDFSIEKVLGCGIADYNNDGYVDFVVSVMKYNMGYSYSRFYENHDGIFEWVNYHGNNTAASNDIWFDGDNDGDLDLFRAAVLENEALNSSYFFENKGGTLWKHTDDPLPGFSIGASDSRIIKQGIGLAADFDKDGRQEVLIIGAESYPGNVRTILISNLWKERKVVELMNIPPILPSGYEIIDLDKDGYLDLFVYGMDTLLRRQSLLLRNYQGNLLPDIKFQLPIVSESGYLHFGDIDLNGEPDVISVPGEKPYTGMSDDLKVFSFVDDYSIRQVYESIIDIDGMDLRNSCILDFDGDKDPDLVSFTSSGMFVYENRLSSVRQQIPIPSQLDRELVGHGVSLSWDCESSGNYSYNLRVGSEKGGINIVSSMSDSETGFLRIPTIGNAGINRFFLLDSLPPGKYFWSVQAISLNKVGGEWAKEDSFEIGVVDVDFEVSGFCSGDPFYFEDLSTGPISNWSWQFGDGGSSNLQHPSHLYHSAGTFEVKLSVRINDDVFSKLLAVEVMKTPEVDFSFESVNLGGETPFINLTDVSGTDIVSWAWDFGDGAGSTNANPISHFYQQTGIFPVTLKATTANGCMDSITKHVSACANIIEQPEIYIRGPLVWYLVCSNDSVNSYQWYLNGVDIQGATEYIYVAGKQLGEYSVEISMDEVCYIRSEAVTIPDDLTNISEDPFSGLKIYPNPTTGLFTIEMDNSILGELNIDIFTESGSKIINIKFYKETSHFEAQVDLSAQPAGVYLIGLKIEEYKAKRKLLVE